MNEWIQINLGDVCTIITGYPFKSKNYSLSSEDSIKVVRGENITEGALRWATTKFWPDFSEDLNKYLLKPGDIVIGMDGSKVGQNRAILNENDLPLILAQRVAAVRSQDSITSTFAWYLIYHNNFVRYIKSICTGTSIPHISLKQIREYPISLPPIQEQKAIAEVLSSLDDKIELLQKQNETLEALVQTLFRQWFIEEADDSWEEVELGTLVDTFNGISYKSSQLKESDVAMVTLKSFARDGSFRLDGFKEFVGEYKDRHECSNGDILVAHTDVTQGALLIGNAIEVRQPKEYRQLLYSMDLVKVVPKNVSDKYFILYTLKNRHFKHHAVGYSNGSTVLHMSKKAVPEYRLKHPPAKLIHDFHEKVSAFKEKQRLNESSIVTLKQTRDTLLPKLMSGQVRVKLD